MKAEKKEQAKINNCQLLCELYGMCTYSYDLSAVGTWIL